MYEHSNNSVAGSQFRLVQLHSTKRTEHVCLFLCDMECVFRVSIQLLIETLLDPIDIQLA
jgi:hypothetical protein